MRTVPLLLGLLPVHCAIAQGGLAAPGLRLFGPINGGQTLLYDGGDRVVQRWDSPFSPGPAIALGVDGTLLRTVNLNYPGAPNGTGGGVQKLSFRGELLWDYLHAGPDYCQHHDIDVLPNGNVLMIVWHEITPAQAIALGRDPALIATSSFRYDSIIEVQPTGPTSGAIVWEWSMLDHIVQDFDPQQQNFGNVATSLGRLDINQPPAPTLANDWNHINGIDYDPIHDWIAFTSPHQNEMWIIDHSTTTAEARGTTGGRWGRGGEFLYRWGNPANYRAGTSADQTLFFVHDPRFIPPGVPGAGHVTLFNNRVTQNNSAAIEIVLPLDPAGNFVLGTNGRYGPVAPIWSFQEQGFFSPVMSSVERLPNGNTLICSAVQNRVFEVTPNGQTVWSHIEPPPSGAVFHAHYVPQTLWMGGSASIAQGGTVEMDFAPGGKYRRDYYWLFGSISGTTPGISLQGVHVPLNPDLFTQATATAANTAMLPGSLGTLDGVGRGQPAFALAPHSIPAALAGLRLDFACVTLNRATLQLGIASNPITVVLRP